jgi:Transposase DDE domain
MQSQQRLVSILQRIRQDVATLLDKEAINAACREEKYTWKDRLLNPVNTIHLFILQVLNQNTPINDLPRKSGESFTGSAYCKARKRLPLGVFKSLVRRLADTLLPRSRSAHADDDEGRWFGHRTFIMDGSSCSMPDTPELQREFGQPGNQRPGCGFPVAHLMVLFHAGTGLLREMLAAPLRTHDMSQAAQLHPALQPGDIALGDRGFCSYAHLALLSLKGVFGVFRIHQMIKVEFSTGEHTTPVATGRRRRLPRWLYRLGATDQVVEWFKPKKAPNWIAATQYGALPEYLVVRVLRYSVGRPGFRTKEVTLVTTLLDADLYPLLDLAELYRQRWQVEQHLRDLKTTLHMDVLRCKTVNGVLKELCVFAMVYNLARVVLCAAARRQGLPIARLSFIDAVRWLRSAKAGEALSKLVVNPNRPDRVEPRVVKRRPKEYDRMTQPRAELRRRLLEGPLAA